MPWQEDKSLLISFKYGPPCPPGTIGGKSGVDKKLRDFATHTHRISKSRVVLFGLKFVLINAHFAKKKIANIREPSK